MDVRKKAIALALDMVGSRNVEDVVLFLKKELVKTMDQSYEKVNSLLAKHSGPRANACELVVPRAPNTASC